MSVLGAGNVATHLARHFHAAGQRIDCIWSRNLQHARELARATDAAATSELGEVPGDSDFYLLAVPDSAIVSVARQLKEASGIGMHAAGAVPLGVLGPLFGRSGVIYPLQSISRDRNVSFSRVPILVEGSDQETRAHVRSLAESISGKVLDMDSDQRLVVHLAAVFANNFTNHMVAVARDILEEQGLDLTLLDPLLEETWDKIRSMGAHEAQTGPALRGDRETMEKHLQLLKDDPGWQKIYTFVSHNIQHE